MLQNRCFTSAKCSFCPVGCALGRTNAQLECPPRAIQVSFKCSTPRFSVAKLTGCSVGLSLRQLGTLLLHLVAQVPSKSTPRASKCLPSALRVLSKCPPSASRGTLGRSWAALGPHLGVLGRLLGVSWRLLARFCANLDAPALRLDVLVLNLSAQVPSKCHPSALQVPSKCL